MKVRVDRELCIGHGLCTQIAAGAFRLDEDGLAAVANPAAANEAALRLAADRCPAGAIYLENDDS